MSYPGERATLSGANGNELVLLDVSWITVDGLKFDGGSQIAGGTHDGATSNLCHDITLRHIESNGAIGDAGIQLMNGLSNILIEYGVFHDNTYQHGVYNGSRARPSDHVTYRRSIAYGNAYNGFTFNGRCNACVFDQLVSYNNMIAGLTLEMGVSNSFVRSNLLFGNTKALNFFNYLGDCAGQGGTGDICPYDQTGNLIENNVFYNEAKTADGAGSCTAGATGGLDNSCQTALQLVNCAVNESGSLGNQTIRNNVFVDYGWANHYPPVLVFNGAADLATGGCGSVITDANTASYLSTSTFDHNIFFQSDGQNGSGVIGYGSSSSFGFQPYTCSGAAAITSMTACINADPRFVAASPNFWNAPASFNFRYQNSSPAIHAGSSVSVPAYDVSGTPFANPPSIGAYEGAPPTSTACDLNGDGVVDALDVQLAINQALGLAACSTADLQQTGQCNVVDVQRVVNASLGAACLVGP
jgi:hypothetical protein